MLCVYLLKVAALPLGGPEWALKMHLSIVGCLSDGKEMPRRFLGPPALRTRDRRMPAQAWAKPAARYLSTRIYYVITFRGAIQEL